MNLFSFFCTWIIELSASKFSLSIAFSKLSRSCLDSEHFNTIDVALREICAAWVNKFSFWVPCFSTKNPLFAYFVHLFSIHCDGKIKTSFMLKTLRTFLHNIPKIYAWCYSSNCLIKIYYNPKSIYIPIDSYFLQEHVVVISSVLNTTVAPWLDCICVIMYIKIDPSVCNNRPVNKNWSLNSSSNSENILRVYDSAADFNIGKFGL
jgi:hypothetical protein